MFSCVDFYTHAGKRHKIDKNSSCNLAPVYLSNVAYSIMQSIFSVIWIVEVEGALFNQVWAYLDTLL